MRSLLTLPLCALLLTAAAPGREASLPSRPSYDPDSADQFQWNQLPDVLPASPAERETWAHALGLDAAVYGGLAVAQYWQMYAQGVDAKDPDYTGFNRFHHERRLAYPGYKAFKTPNVDTLYSNAWLDLTAGPVRVTVPPMDAGRYFAFNLLDAYGNASNISTRIQGNGGGTYLIATTDWRGDVPPGTTLFRVTTPYVWVLLRIKANDAADARRVAKLQDAFKLTPTAAHDGPAPQFPDAADRSAFGYFRMLDFILRANGHPRSEDALVYRWHGIGLAEPKSLDAALADPAIRRGLETGHADAMKVIADSVTQAGLHLDHWRSPYDAGRMGWNYLERTGLMIATGANVPTENYAFVTYVDADGDPLDGSKYTYELVQTPPPAKYYRSYTPYLRENRELIPNTAAKYIINDRTPGLKREGSGRLRAVLSAVRPKGVAAANWLPVSAAPFVLAIRSQGPDKALLDGTWTPAPIRKLQPVR
ncbi:DUF1254 domain-containing protein [Novosphingobium sp. 11B]